MTYKDLIKKIIYNPDSNKMHHALVWILSWHCNSERISWSRTQRTWRWLEREDDWDTTDRAILTTFTATYKEYKKTLIDVIDDLTRHSYIAKLKITSSWYSTKSNAITGLKNITSCMPWLYTTWDQIVASKIIHHVFVLWEQPFHKLFESYSNNACLLS